MARLVLLGPGGDEGRSLGLALAETTIGRGLANTVPLRGDDRVSLRHAVIRRGPEGYVLSDAGSVNGTWVNGERIKTRLLEDGDEIAIGATRIRFERRARIPRPR